MSGGVRRLVPKFVRRRYALKFMLALFVLATAVGGVGFFGTQVVAEDAKQQVKSDSVKIAQKDGDLLEKTISQQNTQTDRLAQEIQTVDPEDRQAFLEREQEQIDGNHHIHYLDVDDNEIISSTNEELVGEKISSVDTAWGLTYGRMGDGIYDNQTIYQGWKTDLLVRYIATIPGRAQDGTYVMNYQTIPNNQSARDKVLVMGQEMSTLGNVLSNEDGRVSYVVNEESTLAGALGDNGTWKEYYLQQQTASGEQEEIAPHGTVAISPDPSVLYEPYGNERNIDLSEVGEEGAVYDIGKPGDALAESVGPEHADKEYIAAARRIDYGRDQFLIVLHTPKEDAFGFAQSVNRNGQLITGGGVFLIVLVGGILGRNTSRSLEQLRQKAEQMEEGDLTVDLESNRIDSIGRLYAGFDSMRTSLQQQIQTAEAARQEAEEARDRTKQINEHLQTKADQYSDVMRECAQGDLTARMDPESENEAMQEIAEEFNAMVTQLEHTTEQVKLFAQQVAAASEEVTASSEEVRNASEQVSHSIQEISGGADRQNKRLQTVEQEMNHLSTTTEEIAASSNEVAQLAENTAKTGQRGRKAAKMAVQSMEKIEDDSEDAVTAIEDLESQMERVDELLEFISSLAQETNMLALNANIEASRGREGGGDGDADGFAVVAEEVKELATETKEATEDIEQILEGLRKQTDKTAEEVEQTADRIAESQDAIENAAGALSKIASYAEETNTGVQEISKATEDQATSVQEVVSMINDVATISEETSSESENVAAAAEEQTSSLTEVTRSAEDLAHQSAELSDVLDQFETDPDQDEDGGFTFGAVPDGNQGAASFK